MIYTKEQCNYQEGEWPHECGTCIHFRPWQWHYLQSSYYPKKSSECKIVYGTINEHAVCDFWTTGKLTKLGETREDISI